MYTLVENIGYNTIRAYVCANDSVKKELIIGTELTQEPNGNELIDFIFEDNGPGFPDDIVRNGFSEGRTEWKDSSIKGTGIGMAYHAKILREHYGGDLIPEYRTDGQGNRIPGALLRVRLRVVQK